MATKASATAFNSYFYQQQHPTANSNATNLNSKQIDTGNMSNEPVNDLHLKMSKKIAQLTKVIYALNSKNDESENLIANIRAQFEEEKEQLILDTNKKLDEYKFRFANATDQTNKLNELELKIKDFQKQKEKAMIDFNELKLISIENEENLTLLHKQELIDLNKMMENLKQDQDKQLKIFEEKIKKYDADKAYLVEDLKSKHRLEIESIKKMHSSNKDNFDVEKAKLQEKYEAEIKKLKDEMELLANKSNKDKAEYEQNMNKLKAFHEKELDALKQNSTNEYQILINNLKFDIDQLNKNKREMEADLKSKYEKKLEEIVLREEEIVNLKETLSQSNSNQQLLNKNLADLNEKINELNVHKEKIENNLAVIELENVSLRERCEMQSRQLVEKSSDISRLEASHMQKSSTINDLNRELATTRERLSLLENERKSLENKSLSMNDKNMQMIKSLEAKLESLNNEKLTEIAELTKKIDQLKESNELELEKIKRNHLSERDELISQHESKINMERALFEEKLLTMQRDLNSNFNTENQKLLLQQNDLKSQLEKALDELKLKTKDYDSELKSLNEKLHKSEQSLNQTNKLNSTLKSEKEVLEKDFSVVNELSTKQKKEIDDLIKELEQMKFLYESTSKDSQLELKVKLENLNKELNAKWSETLRAECDKLRKDIVKLKEEEKLNELNQLTSYKDEEIQNLKSIWQSKTNELLEEISILKKELSEREVKEREKYEQIKRELEAENRDLHEKLINLSTEYKSKLDHLQSQQNQETKTLLENLIKENEEKINELKNKHLEDLKSQSIAQKAVLSSLKDKLEKNKQLELEMQLQEHNKKMEMAKYEMEQSFYTEMDKLKHENEIELLAIRGELDKANDTMKQKEREYEMKYDEHQTESRVKQKHINKLSDDLKELKNFNSMLKEEIDQKNLEIKQIKLDVQEELKNKDILMKQHLQEQISHLNAENMRQKQILVNEFRQAQELLKQKIIQTESELKELHERFLNRESRAEDIEMISLLKRQLADYEEKFRMLKDEKKYFQMELLNRENNFNKIFNTTPNIGVINPLNANTKIKPKGAFSSQIIQKTSSQFQSGSSAARLEPIPGVESPLHDLSLNPNKILPKKFLN